MSEKFVLYISGGTMRGAYAAGFVSALEDADAYDHIEAIYASSSGALVGAYFLARQTKLGSSIYFENLQRGFILPLNFFLGIWDRLIDSVRPKKGRVFHDALDMGYLLRIMREEKPLNLDRVTSHHIPLYIKLFDITRRVWGYRSIKEEEAWNTLRASVTLMPYVYEPVRIDEHRYVDACILDQIGFAELRSLHPGARIVVVFCGDAEARLRSRLKNHIEGFFAYLMHGKGYYDLFTGVTKRLKADQKLIEADGNADFFAIDRRIRIASRTRDPEKIRAIWRDGYEAGNRFCSSLESGEAS